MIGETSSGRRFAALVQYLLHGRSGDETERVAWTAGRNLGTDDPEIAADIMQSTAATNRRIAAPVYHLTISFDPDDSITPQGMRLAADRVLGDLGLAEHQALFVAHQDRDHPHVHIMVNRVHPHTHAAWDRWRDRMQIERSLRELERELGLREVAGRLYQLESQIAPERAALTKGEHHQALRTGEPAFAERVRGYASELLAARSWHELNERLAGHGLRVEGKGQGLVITDGEHQVKASRVARELALRRLETRFGVAYPDREPRVRAPARQREPLNPRAKQVLQAVEEYERTADLTAERSRAEHDLAMARQREQRLEAAMERAQGGSERFEAALARVYQDPAAARARFLRVRTEHGIEKASTLLEAEPERFGALNAVVRPRALGLLQTHDDAAARAGAPGAAFLAREWAEAKQALAALAREQEERGDSDWPARLKAPLFETTRARAVDAVTRAQERLRDVQRVLKDMPSLGEVERGIRRLVAQLEPPEERQLRLTLTAPQAALAFRAREAAKTILLGRDERER